MMASGNFMDGYNKSSSTSKEEKHIRGFFIAFEGIDGTGKETQLLKTREWLERMYPDRFVAWSSEPNDQSSPIGQTIRKILQHNETFSALRTRVKENPIELQRMYVVDRAQDIFCFIEPVIRSGGIYLIERYGFSTIAYGMLSGEPAETFIELHKQVLGPSLVWPDLTVLIDISAETAVQRIKKRIDDKKLFDGVERAEELFEKQEMLERVRANYLSLVHHSEFKDNIAVVSGEQSKEKVFEDIKLIIEQRLAMNH
jgi:dTMP kinase